MSRTFSLRFLIALVTAFAVVIGIAVNYPGFFWPTALVAAHLAPAALMSSVFTFFSSQRVVTAVATGLASLAGALAGAILFSSLFSVVAYSADFSPSLWEWYVHDWLAVACCSAIAACIAGVFLLQFFPRGKSRRHSQHK